MKTDAQLLRWLELRDCGWTARQIAEDSGCPRNTVIRGLWNIDTQLEASERPQRGPSDRQVGSAGMVRHPPQEDGQENGPVAKETA